MGESMSDKQCPFVSRKCIRARCVGWQSEQCFVQLLPSFALQQAEPRGGLALIPADETPTSVLEAAAARPVVPSRPPWEPRPWQLLTAARTAIDFGTSQSKIAFRGEPVSGRVDGELRLLGGELIRKIPSTVVVTADDFLHFGLAAEEAAHAEWDQGRKPAEFRNMKLFLARDGFKGPKLLAAGPFNVHWTEALTLFLAHLFAKGRLSDVGDVGKWATANFTLPVNIDSNKTANLRKMLLEAVHLAEIVGPSETLPFEETRAALRAIRAYDALPGSEVLGQSVAEPLAALLAAEATQLPRPSIVLSVDSGAGTTDICWLGVPDSEDRAHTVFGEARVDWGGYDIDRALRSLVEAGGGQVREGDLANRKRELLRDSEAIVGGVHVTSEQLNSHPITVAGLAQVTAAVDRSFRDMVRPRLADARLGTGGDPPVKILLSGGNSLLRPLRRTVEDAVALGRPFFSELQAQYVRPPRTISRVLEGQNVAPEDYSWLCMAVGASRQSIPPVDVAPTPAERTLRLVPYDVADVD